MKLIHMNKKVLFAVFALFLTTVGLGMAFSNSILSESAYRALIGDQFLSSFSPENLLVLSALISFLTASIIFLSFYHDNISFPLALSLLFLFSPAILSNLAVADSFYNLISAFVMSIGIFIFKKYENHLRFASIIFFIASIIIYSNHLAFSYQNLFLVGMTLPLAMLSLSYMETFSNSNSKQELAVLAFGFVLAFVFPGISLIILTYSASSGFEKISNTKNPPMFWAVVVFFLVLMLSFLNSDSSLIGGASIAFAISLLFYFMFFIMSVEIASYRNAVIFFFILLSVLSSSFVLSQSLSNRASGDLIFTYMSSKSVDGNIGLFAFENSYKYYSGKDAVILTPEDLLASNKLDADYVIIDSTTLYEMYDNSSIVFRFDSSGFTADSPQSVLFINSKQILATTLSSDFNSVDADAMIQDSRTGSVKSVSFTKLRALSRSIPLTDKRNILVNIDNLGESNLFNLLYKNQQLFATNTTLLVKAV